jgi:multidrug efflux pump subunit AcrB
MIDGKPPGGFFSNFFMLYLIFGLASTITSTTSTTTMTATMTKKKHHQHTAMAVTAAAAAAAARDATCLEPLVCFILSSLH